MPLLAPRDDIAGFKITSFAARLAFLCLFPVAVNGFESPLGITGATTINVFQAKYLYDQGAVFIDVRSDEEWQIGHIQDAIHLDFQRDFGFLYQASDIPRDTPLVIYCNSIDCLRSAYACSVSVIWGFSRVYYFRSGYFAWLLEDFPVVTGILASMESSDSVR